ncbi:hypothetical protein EV401DRAFT_829008 [Pisolithus croceorrhizus]|nr:hypothetical protein EV401DRAFT_829008 [Pisolithus croceorrhizus]
MYTQVHLFPLGSYLVVWALSHLSEHIQGISRGLWNLDGRTSRVSTRLMGTTPLHQRRHSDSYSVARNNLQSHINALISPIQALQPPTHATLPSATASNLRPPPTPCAKISRHFPSVTL